MYGIIYKLMISNYAPNFSMTAEQHADLFSQLGFNGDYEILWLQ